MTGPGRRELKRLDRLVLGELGAGARRRLQERMAMDPELRQAHDLRVEVMRALERKDVSELELQAVQSRLLGEPEAPRGPALARWTLVGLAAAAAAALVLWVGPGESTDEFGVRGASGDAGLAIEVLCAANGSRSFAAVSDGACSPHDVMAVTHRVDETAAPDARYLTVFGVGHKGTVHYYAPTPDASPPVVVDRGQWSANDVVVRLEVNHDPGTVRVYALLSPFPATVEEIDRWGEALGHEDPATLDQEPWIDRVPGALLREACPSAGACEAAETSFVIGRTR